jgi:lysophospholipase L1-like esterase
VKKLREPLKQLSIFIGTLLVFGEVSARFFVGLGNPPLYQSSDAYGYRHIPNQNIRRFGNRVFYNAEGLRSEPTTTYPALGTIRILCIGDSITNGGVRIDQSKTYPYLLQDVLNQNQTQNFEVLNASAGGWAIENIEGFLRQKGVFYSHIVVLQLGSHDLFQPKVSGEIVGTINFPDRKPFLALEEGIFRYLLPNVFPNLHIGERLEEQNLQTSPTKVDLNRNISSLIRIAKLVRSKNAQLIVVLVEQPEELEPQDELTNYGKKIIADKANLLNIKYHNLKQELRNTSDTNLFLDGLHPNIEGNQVIANSVAELIQENLNYTSKKE